MANEEPMMRFMPMPATQDSGDLLIATKDITCREVHLSDDIEPMLRVYRRDPQRLMVQIRNHGTITEKRQGKPRNMVASAILTPSEAKALRNKLNEFLRIVGEE